MRQFINVLKFELGNYFKNKSFVVVTILLMAAAFAGVAIPAALAGNDKSEEAQEETVPEDMTAMALLDEEGVFSEGASISEMLPMYDWTLCGSEDELRDMVREESVEAGIVVTGPTSYQYIVENNDMFGKCGMTQFVGVGVCDTIGLYIANIDDDLRKQMNCYTSKCRKFQISIDI